MAKKPRVTVSKKLQAIQDADPKTKKPGRNPRTRPEKPAPASGKKISKAAAKAKKTTAAQRYFATRLINDPKFAYKRGWEKFYNEKGPDAPVAAQKKFAAAWAKQAPAIGRSMLKSIESGTAFSSRVANAIKNAPSTNSPLT